MWFFLLDSDPRLDEGKLVLASDLLPRPFLEIGSYRGAWSARD
jgi:hypothetical protein